MPRPRPTQPPTPPRDAFAVHRAEVADGISLAYVREGVGGYPLVLVHECGHFLQWERADVLNELARFFFADLLSG